MLIVPHNRRRKMEALLGAARVKATWATPPTADEIRTRDQGLSLGRQVSVKLGDQAGSNRPENQGAAAEQEQGNRAAKQKRSAAPN